MRKRELLKIIKQAKLKNYTFLDLSEKDIKKLPSEIGQLINLTELYLNNNKLTSLPPEIGQLQNLVRLDVSENRIKTIPKEIGQLTNLTELYLNTNKLTELPPEIGQLQNLESLLLGENKLKNLPPEIGYLINLMELYLKNNKLTFLLPEIGQLQNLTSLDVGDNKLTTIPPEVGRLTKIMDLYLNNNKLTTLPLEIGQLQNLKNLDLSENKLKTIPPEIKQLINLTKLDLFGNSLSKIPIEIGELINLMTLNIGKNKLTALPTTIGQLANLRTLYLYNNKLNSLPPDIGNLTELVILRLYNNRLDSLPEEIGHLVKLMTLYLDNNQLTSLPSKISNLTNLTELYLNGNKLTSLSPQIGKLTNLTKLELSNNQLTSLSPYIGNLARLETLDLSRNKLTTIPVEIGQLSKLKELYLFSNKLSIIPPEIGRLNNLQKLYLSTNKLTTLPLEIKNLSNLTELYLSDNILTEILPEIGLLNNLQKLYLSTNKLKTLPLEFEKLTNLTELGLRKNQLTSLPTIIAEMTGLRELWLDDNPIKNPPPEIIKQGVHVIRDYLTAFKKIEFKGNIVYEAKLIIVGQAGVGKTSLCNRLLFDSHYDKESSTEGISIRNWELMAPDGRTSIDINIWDFGGQEIYHATHKFFLTQRSVYILVWDARHGDEYGRLDYWLHTIEAFGGDSPILLVLNKCDVRIQDINFKELKEKFPQIYGFYQVSCKIPELGLDSFNRLTKDIAECAWNLPLMGTQWIDRWFEIRLIMEADNRNQMDHTEYLALCSKHGIEQKQADILSEYLHDLGVILHFQTDSLLRHTIILKPEWCTTAVYKILAARTPQENKGVLLESDLPNIWIEKDGYPQVKHKTLLRLMSNFELSFPMKDTHNHIVAELLPRETVDFDWNYEDNLRFEYHYSFMPAGIMPRLIVRIHKYLERDDKDKYLCWLHGALISRDGARVYVKAIPINRKIEIRVIGINRRKILTLIRQEFDHIHNSIRKVTITRKIRCQCSRGCNFLFDYDVLCKMELRKIQKHRCEKSFKEVSVAKLLDSVETRKEWRMWDIKDNVDLLIGK